MATGFRIDVEEAEPGRIKEVQDQLKAAAREVAAEGNLPGRFMAGLLQLLRFVQGNIEVDTGRTKNSIFPAVEGQGNSVLAYLGSNVSYSPYVRDAGHGQHFFDYAEEREVPRVLAMLGEDVVANVERHFD